MAAQFESLMHPLVIMFTIPLAFLGTFLGLTALGISLSIVVFLGMIMLAGIVVNNAIVLVDYINTLKRRGLSRDDAVVQAGSVRLRPDPDDDRHHRPRPHPDGLGARRRRRDPYPDGDRRHQRLDRLDRPDAIDHPDALRLARSVAGRAVGTGELKRAPGAFRTCHAVLRHP